MGSYWLSKFGALLCGGGIVWAAHIATDGLEYSDYFDVLLSRAFVKIVLSPGPVELLGAGLLIWLFAKWRSSVDIRKV